ncbi:subtilisin-like protease SBT3 [Ricinus communis]|uniref:subtilisin-like protease SBT3 n=1 Tax=Ricinus communis TaxID=3988 RepID=UPI00201B1B22|nr:subtilisin-like protease SBT3 [Ricinus communis]
MASHYNSILSFLWLSFITFWLFIIPTLAETDNYIVHMDLSAMPEVFSSHHSWYLATLSSAFAVSNSRNTINTTPARPFSSKLLYSYTHVINGFSAHLSLSELEALKNTPGYISSIRDLPVKLDTTRSPTFLGLTGNSGAWQPTNFGEDVIIGVVDTGIWPESESYSDNGISEIPKRWKGECESGTEFNTSLCNKKLIGARFFNKALIAKTNGTVSMNSTRDTDGHGTHTSSTAAGNFVQGASFFGYASGTASGVAPKAHVAMYKALWDEGAYTADIIAAIDQAIIDGVDVVSISLGLDGVPLYDDPIALATFAAAEKNIFVSTSAGNEGPYLETLHNGIPWVLTVAAGTVDREFSATVTLENGASVTGSALYPGNYSSSQVPIVFLDSCLDSKELNKVGKKIVVCEDKNASLDDQFDNLRKVNISGGIFITNFTDLELFIQSGFPAIFVSPKDGETIKDFINSSTSPQASMEFQKTNFGIKSAPSLASYSSRGPSPSCPYVMKPDIMGPGSLILAAWPQNIEVMRLNSKPLFSNFNILSGTSMSCPHAAGVAALLKNAHPDWSPAAIRSAMMTTVVTMDHTPGPIKDIGNNNQPASPLDMGAGQVNPSKALDPGLIYDLKSTDYVKLLCALNFTEKQIQIITRSSSNDCSSPSLDLNYPSFIAFFNSNVSKSSTVQEFHRTVTNVGEGMSTYTANLTPINGLKVSVVPDKLEFKAKNEKLSYKLVIEGPTMLKESIIFGYLSWVDDEGKHTVKSPIVATRLSSDLVSS